MTAPDHDLRRKTVHGLFWQFLGVGGQRIVAMIPLTVIARAIDKDDVGLFAIVLTGIAVIESLTLFMGEQSTISSARGTDRRYLDTVFTVRVLRSIAITGLLCALAPAFAWFFGTPQYREHYWLTGLFLVLAGNGLIDGLQSPARAARLKGMEFRRIVFCDFLAAVFGMLCTVAFALLWGNVWALLAGHMCGTAMRTLFSYVAAPHRPRIAFDRDALRELLHYSKGAAGAPFLLVMVFASPALVLGRFLYDAQGQRDPGGLAEFDYASRLARLPEDIFLRVLAPVAIPAYAHLRHDTPRLSRAWLGAVRTFLLVGVPMSVTLAWCGSALPGVVFGDRYGEITSLFAVQSLHGGLAGLTSVVGPLFWAVGIPGKDRTAQLFRGITIYAVGIPATLYFGVIGFAWSMVAGILVALTLSLAAALRYLAVSPRQLLATMRDGTLLGGALGITLLLLDLVLPTTGLLRVLVAAALSGPVLGMVTLRLLRQRRGAPGVAPRPAAVDPSP
ncbi:MAG: oligosaccharide flippase family protein [Planctomycetes bacterium]|nr:oligosaccharide flippase family protein [Planctomycetota bacterium]